MEIQEDYYRSTCRTVIGEIETALLAVDAQQVERFINDLLTADKVFFIGVGRVMLSLKAFAKRLAHLGVDAHCVGDITEPAITDKDILIVGSGSGESIVPLAIAKKAKEIGVKKIIHIGSNMNGSMSNYADYMVRIPVKTKLNLLDEIDSAQIMTSLFEQSLLVIGDVVAKMIAEECGINIENLRHRHANLE